MFRGDGRIARWTAAAAVAAVVATACSDSSDDAEPGATITTGVPNTTGASGGSTTPSTDPVATGTDSTGTSSSPTTTPSSTTQSTNGPLPEPSVDLIEVGSFDQPTGIAVRPGDDRVFVMEQPGRILAVDGVTGDSDVVLDITDRVTSGGEQGLIGLAFHPREDDLAYVHYSGDGGETTVVEYAIDPDSATFDSSTARTLLALEQPFGNHNGGQLAFGPDELLYLGLGDGGSADDPLRAGLDLSTPLGKILRLDPAANGDEAFTVPADNPFVDVDGADPTIWSYGLRNPWRFSFDEQTGDLWIADVGQNEIEEVNHVEASGGLDAGRGVSFGWSAFEGEAPFNDDQPTDGHLGPRLTYTHQDGRCSVSGGVVYRGGAIADAIVELDGWYVYGDYCSGEIWGFDPTAADERIVELGNLPELVSVELGPNGELYAVSNGGTLARFTGS